MRSNPPDALLLLAPACPHCPGVLEALARLVKDGRIGALEVVNVAVRPERARQLGVRSAPWTRIGELELEGARSFEELARWAALAGSDEGLRAYVSEHLKAGRLTQLESLVTRHPHWLPALLPLVADPQTELHVRIGLSALIEGLSGSEALRALVPALGALSTDGDHRVRSDACHYLALSGDPGAEPFLRARLQDEAPEVREIARDGLDALASPS